MASGLVACLPQARACEFFGAHLRITHPWTRASAAGASTAIVCMKFDEVTQADRLIGIETPVAAGAELGGLQTDSKQLSLALAAGQNYELSETGIFVRLLDLKHPLALGRSYPLTLLFEHSGAITAELSVDYEAT